MESFLYPTFPALNGCAILNAFLEPSYTISEP